MIKWRIYYSDKTTFSSLDGFPHQAPTYGVQAICQPEPDVGLETLHAFDYYIFREGIWNGFTGTEGLVDHVSSYVLEIEALVVGRQIPRQQYQEIMRIALHDPDFPRKSNTHKGERPL